MLNLDKNIFADPISNVDHSELIKKVAAKIVRRRMSAPASLLIESLKPINRIAGQAVLVVSPFLTLFVSYEKIEQFCDMLQDRKNVEKLLNEIKNLEDEK